MLSVENSQEALQIIEHSFQNQKDIKIYPEFLEPNYKNCVSNYEDVSIEQSVLGQLELGGFKLATTKQDADIILIINNFINITKITNSIINCFS